MLTAPARPRSRLRRSRRAGPRPRDRRRARRRASVEIGFDRLDAGNAPDLFLDGRLAVATAHAADRVGHLHARHDTPRGYQRVNDRPARPVGELRIPVTISYPIVPAVRACASAWTPCPSRTTASRRAARGRARPRTRPSTRSRRRGAARLRRAPPPGQVAPEAVGVADRDDPDPRRPLGDPAAAVAGRLARLHLTHLRQLRLPTKRRLEPVLRGIGAERRDPVERDPAARRVEARRRIAERPGAVGDVAGQRRVLPVAAPNRSIWSSVNAASQSADAKWLISPTTSRPGAGSSASPQRPIPVSSFRWTRTPSGISPSRSRARARRRAPRRSRGSKPAP